MCKSVNKQFNDYCRLKSTKEFLTELSKSTGLPIESQNGNFRLGINKGLLGLKHGTYQDKSYNSRLHMA